MTGWIILGVLAAFGVLSGVWALFGWLFSCGIGGALVCMCRPGGQEMALVQRYSWLRGVGLIRSPMLLVGSTLSLREQALLCRKYPGIEFCSLEELAPRLEVERDRLDRA